MGWAGPFKDWTSNLIKQIQIMDLSKIFNYKNMP